MLVAELYGLYQGGVLRDLTFLGMGYYTISFFPNWLGLL